MSETNVVTVSGMTCEHCVASVSEEIGEIAGVSAVDVELATGRVVITSNAPLNAHAIQVAVEGAGYHVEP